MRPYRQALLLSALVAGLAGVAGPLTAQAVGSIRGKVVEENTLRPLSGVQVTVPGTGRGALTNASGAYLISNVPLSAKTVEANMLGYRSVTRPVELGAGHAVDVDFTLSQQAISLNEIVVTGVPGATSKRTLGTSVTTVNAAAVTAKTTINSMTDLLQGRAPGVVVMGNGGTVGAAGSLTIHGISSLSGNNQPAVYVDGVRVYIGAAGNFSNVWNYGSLSPDGGQSANALSMINPEDIQSIEVLKGPAAATLYGADAAAGVINIITKKGTPGQQSLSWDFRAQYGRTDWAAGALRNYTACTSARDTAHLTTGELAWTGCQGQPQDAIISYSGLTDNPYGLRSGLAADYNLSVRGGGDGYSFYIAGDRNDDQGVFFNNYMKRLSGRANFAFYPSAKFDFNVNVGYDNTHTRFPANDNGGAGQIISASFWNPGYNYKAAYRWDDTTYQKNRGFAWNPPSISNQFDNQLFGNRLTMSSTVNYRPFSWLSNRLTVGMDKNDRRAVEYFAPQSSYSTPGAMYTSVPDNSIYTVDYAGTIDKRLNAAFDSKLSVGMQYTLNKYQMSAASGEGFASQFNRMVAQAAQTFGYDSAEQTALLGYFAQEQVGWRDRLYLTGAVRMDNSSVFGEDIKRIFYPKVMASYIISDEPWFHVRGVDQLKLRAAWGAAGNAPGPFAAVRTYNAIVGTLPDGSPVAGVTLGAFGNNHLKPERSQELEAGFDASFLQNRAGLTLTYYNKQTRDAILAVPLLPSGGFTGSQYQNLGQISNKSLEVELTGTPVQTRWLSWDSHLSLYTNHNKLVSFGYDRSPITIGYYGEPQEDRPGYPVGGFWAKRFVKNADGSYVRTAPSASFPRGKLVVDSLPSYIGPSTPTREISFANTLTFLRNLDFYFLLDYKGGYYQYDYKDLSRCAGGRCQQVAQAEATVDNPNSSAADKQSAQEWLDVHTASGGIGTYDRKINFIQRADFIRVGDVSLTYHLPQRYTQLVGGKAVSLNVAAHDLGFLWKPYYGGADPDVNFYGPDDVRRIDSWTAPGLRRITASVNVSF